MNSPTHPSLPKGWIVAALDDCAEAQLGKMLDKLKRIKGWRLQYLRNANVRWGHFDLSDLLEMPFEEHELERYALRQGDVLVCEGGEPGRAAIWTLENSDIKFQKALHRVRMHGGINPNWLVQRLYFDSIRGTLGSAFTGTTINHLPLVALKQYRLPIPPLTEQKRILAVVDATLSKLDAAVAALERVRANLKRYWASVLKAAVEGRLVPIEADLALKEGRDFEPASMLLERILAERRRRWEESEVARLKAAGKPPKDDRWKSKYKEPVAPDTSTLPQLPAGWCWATVDQLISEPLSNGRSVQTDPEGFPVLRLTALKGNAIDLSERKGGAWTVEAANPFLVVKGDFFVARGNGSIRLVGWGGLVDCEPDPVAFPDTLIRLRLAKGSVLAKLLAHVWNSRWIRDQIEHKAKTTAGIHKVNQTDLSRCILPVAPMREQQRVLSELERMTSIALIADQTVAAAEARCYRLRQSILKWAFEGKLVDQDPNDEPASVLLERIRAKRAAMPSRKSRRTYNHQTEASK